MLCLQEICKGELSELIKKEQRILATVKDYCDKTDRKIITNYYLSDSALFILEINIIRNER